MVEARRRGLTFEVWWDEAMASGQPDVLARDPEAPDGAVRWPTDRSDRTSWRAAIGETKDSWRRAFEREEPTPSEQAVAVLADAIGAAQAAEARAARARRTPAAA